MLSGHIAKLRLWVFGALAGAMAVAGLPWAAPATPAFAQETPEDIVATQVRAQGHPCKDPLSAHGITDALRDAELLARAIEASLSGKASEANAFANYQQTRDRLSAELFTVIEEVAGFGWDLTEIRRLLVAASKAMKDEIEMLMSFDAEPAAAAA